MPLNIKISKYALCMNLLPKGPKYANMHGKNMITVMESLSHKTNI